MSGMSASTWNRALGERLAPAARLVVCAALPWYVCVWLGTSTAPVAAALPAVLVLREDLFSAPRMALQRLLGVIAGVLLSAVGCRRAPRRSWSSWCAAAPGCTCCATRAPRTSRS
ncbi:hypothetical protein J7E99_27840 [Streptomyces sp. ISL-44]|uniref:hypothetical protein n=1 Tax=Streptomyces sp. ISL-44 TaxID=2819184 RepID=UPI001BE9F699|nr:hypothetical protein [Streptomyces sp. ISL-44]MBT2544409.1 hypothetical protein [Streptomyces sp. ISL-44]